MDLVYIYLVVALAWLLGGVAGGATGLGTVMISLPLMCIVISASDAVLVSCMIGIVLCTQLAFAYHKACLWLDIRDIIIGTIPGCLIGVLILKLVPIHILQLMISLLLACFVLLQVFNIAANYKVPKSRIIDLSAGLICGIVNTSVSMMGAPLGSYAMLKGWEPDRLRGNITSVFAISMVGTILSQAFAGLYTLELVKIACVGVLGGFIGQYLGIKLGKYVNKSLMTRIILIFLSFVSLSLAYQALK